MGQNDDMSGRDERDDASDHGSRAPRDRRSVSVLFVDVVGSTALIERMDVERAWAVLNPVLDAMVRVVERNSGTLIDRLGDGIMAVFGLPIMLEDHAQCACHAALAIQEEMGLLARRFAARHEATPTLRIGLNSGPVIVTEATEGVRKTYGAMGASVHLAARMQTTALPGTICLSEHTFRLVRHQFFCRPLGAKPLKGFNEPQPVYELLRWEPTGSARGLLDYDIESALVGRTEDLASLAQAMTRLAAGEGGIVLVTGEAGIGKSRLLSESRRLLPLNAQWLEGRSLSFSQSISYWPFVEMLKPLLGAQDRVRSDESWATLERTLLDLFGNETPDFLPYLAALLGMEMRAPFDERLRNLAGEVLGAQIFRACHRLFEGLARKHPLVVAMEDLHWADASSRALLAHLLPLAATTPILFIVLSRPDPECIELLRAVGERDLPGRYAERAIAPLPLHDCRALVISILGDAECMRPVHDLILAKADGNPFFVEEVVRALIDAHALTRNTAIGTWEVRDQPLAIPDTIQGVVMARVDRLDRRLKEILGVAAVLGRTFLYRVLRAVTTPDVELDQPLSRLTTIQLLEQIRAAPELCYLFRHALAHDTIYENLLLDTRRLLHGKIADSLETLYAGRLHEVTSSLAFHFVRAEKWDKALHYLLAAADQSTQVAADDEALAHYEQAVEAYGRAFGERWDKVQRATIDRRLGEIHLRRGEHRRAAAHLVLAIQQFGDEIPAGKWATRLAIARESCHHVLQLLLPCWLTNELTDRFDAADEAHLRPYELLGWVYFLSDQEHLVLVMLRAANLARRLGAAEAVAKTLAGLGLGLDLIGRRRIAYRYHRQAALIAGCFGMPSTSAFVQGFLGIHFFHCGRWREAEQCFREAQQTSDHVGDLLLWSDASVLLCELWSETGEFQRVLDLADRMLKLAQEAGFRPALRWGLVSRGKALRRLGRSEEALPVLRQAVELALSMRDLVSGASAASELALLLLEIGRMEEARQTLDQVHQQLKSTKIRVFTIGALDAALAEYALRRVEQGVGQDRTVWHEAERACRTAVRAAQIYGVGLPASLRLAARLSWLRGRRRRAGRLWDQAASLAMKRGANYELGLVDRERGARRAASLSRNA